MGLERATDARVRPSAVEQGKMEGHLHAALDAGFLGMSTMTNPWDKVGGDRFRSRKLPSTYATWGEYRRFHRILRKRGRVLQSAPNITTKVNMFAFLAESMGWGLRKALKTSLITAADPKSNPFISRIATFAADVCNHAIFGGICVGKRFRCRLKCMQTEWTWWSSRSLAQAKELAPGGCPRARHPVAGRILPAPLPACLRPPKFGPRVWHRDFYDATIVALPEPALVGKSFGAIADARGIHPVDAFLDLVVQFGESVALEDVDCESPTGAIG